MFEESYNLGGVCNNYGENLKQCYASDVRPNKWNRLL